MATTSNYGWTIPDDTDLVKNGALAIRTLGNAIDTTAAASFGGGLVHIKTTTFSAVTSFSEDGLFSSAYKNYKLVLNIEATTDAAPNLQLRFRTFTSPADITTANYTFAFDGFTYPSTAAGGGSTNATSGLNLSSNDTTMTMDIYNPFQTQKTFFTFNQAGELNTFAGGGFLNLTTSCGGITFFNATANLSGSMRVYGYKD